MRKHLTDANIDSLAAKSKRYMIFDKLVPELAVRVSTLGRKSFVIVSRFNGAKHPTRRKLGAVGRMTLDKARKYHLAKPCDRFATVAERYIDHIKHQRRAIDVERRIRRESSSAGATSPLAQSRKAICLSTLPRREDRHTLGITLGRTRAGCGIGR